MIAVTIFRAGPHATVEVKMPTVPRQGEYVWLDGGPRKVAKVTWLVSTDPTCHYDGVHVTVR